MNKKNSLSKITLLILEKAVDGFVRFEDFGNNPGFYAFGYDRQLNKSSIAMALKRLREGGFIEFVNDEELALRITDKGRSKALWTKMKLEDEKWDGKWRLVIWDIPEKRKKVRDLFRYQLKQLGFEKIQNSVWASKKNCTFILNEYIKKVGIEDWVKVMEAGSIYI